MRIQTTHFKDDFKTDCKFYLFKKNKIKEIEETKSDLLRGKYFDEAKFNPSYYQKLVVDKEATELSLSILKSSVANVDKQFTFLAEQLCDETDTMLYEKLVEGKSIEEVALKYYMHPNTLKNKQRKAFKLLEEGYGH